MARYAGESLTSQRKYLTFYYACRQKPPPGNHMQLLRFTKSVTVLVFRGQISVVQFETNAMTNPCQTMLKSVLLR